MRWPGIFLFVSLTAFVAVPAGAGAKEDWPDEPPNLKVLTWNIWMMPWFTFQSPYNVRRAEAIAEALLDQDADILCLEKAFDSAARKVLAERLRFRYPYNYGPINRDFGIKINGGVWILSHLPLVGYTEIEFRHAAGIERFSRK